MKLVTLQKFSLFLLLNSSLLAIENGTYIEVGAGLGYEDTLQTQGTLYTYERNYITNFIVGYQYNLFRVEVETRYKKDSLYSAKVFNNSDIPVSGTFTQQTEMLNTYYSGYNATKFVTSIGGGVGITTKKLENLNNSSIFSAQALLSVGYRITENFILSTKYSYFYTQKSDAFNSNTENIFLFNARYIF